MTRQYFAGAWYVDALPSGEFCVLFPNSHIQTHLGRVEFPAGESWGVGYLRLTNVGSFRFAGQAHDRNDVNYEWRDGLGWRTVPTPYLGVSPVIYDLYGTYHQNDGSAGSQGYRYVRPDNTIATGDETYQSTFGLSQWTDLGDGLKIGQAHPDDAHDAAWIWYGTVHRLLEAGPCTFIRAERAGELVAVSFIKTDGAVTIQTTMAELRALPPVGVTEPPIPPIEPGPIDPPVEPPVEPPIEPPTPEPPSPFRTHKGLTMNIDGKIVILRGPAGKLASPDAPNTGTWGDLGTGWRGVSWAGAHDGSAATHHRAVKLPNGRYLLVSEAHNGIAGADATKHSGAIDQQFYYKPDGNPDAGGYEQWRVYDGNENGAIEAQIEYTDEAGRYFSCPLAVEVVG